jgi:hypothetical protein
MTFFVPPDSHKPRGLTSAPVAETFRVGGLVPGLDDIPYVRGDFAVGTKMHSACCTFWRPDTEESLLLAAGGVLQILTFGPRPAVQHLSAALLDQDIPDTPVITGVARYMYERVHRTSWDAASAEAKENWEKLASGAYDVFLHWYKASNQGPKKK